MAIRIHVGVYRGLPPISSNESDLWRSDGVLRLENKSNAKFFSLEALGH